VVSKKLEAMAALGIGDTHAELLARVARLQTHVRRLTTFLRILLALLRIVRPDLTYLRIPQAEDKARLLRAIQRSREILGHVPAQLAAARAAARRRRLEMHRAVRCAVSTA
jgi:hypothetical protein